MPLKTELFSSAACEAGTYKGRTCDFCLNDACSSENLHSSIRAAAVEYFRARGIPWHDGKKKEKGRDAPSNHLCCSQSFCVNVWFSFNYRPDMLKAVLSRIGYPVKEILPFEKDGFLANGNKAIVSFEWTGLRNYLGEHKGGRVAGDKERSRGSLFTSADFAFRLRREDGRVQIVLGEWKYTERYVKDRCIRYSGSGTDRLKIYEPGLSREDCQIQLPEKTLFEALFFDPFDQLMRLQLLASAMESESEMGADVVSVLHIAPRANRELMNRITSPALSELGNNIHYIWHQLVAKDRFRGLYVEELIPAVISRAPDQKWAEYMQFRYSGIR